MEKLVAAALALVGRGGGATVAASRAKVKGKRPLTPWERLRNSKAVGSLVRSFESLSTRAARWFPLVCMLMGYVTTYVLVLFGTLGCLCQGGVFVGGGFALSVFAVGVVLVMLLDFPTWLMYFTFGTFVSLLPASLLGSGNVVYQECRGTAC